MEFVKMSGAGNDFLAVDNRDGSLDDLLTAGYIERVCTRSISVGADGLLELRSDPEHLFGMRYYNSDGGRADMCGNGGRCIAVFASMLGMAGDDPFTFRSDAGVHRAVVSGPAEARIWMTDPREVFLDRTVELPGGGARISLVDTGVPHAVELAESPGDGIFARAPLVRRHPDMGEHGANYDLVVPRGDGLLMRTWERGVEGETLACGTGAVAAAYVAHRLLGTDLPVDVGVRSGMDLRVGRDSHGWWLAGEARAVFRGTMLSG
jgi:diaminopimelate epimerase